MAPLVLVVLVATLVPASGTAAAQTTRATLRPRTAAASNLAALRSSFLSVTPSLGPVWVVDVQGESTQRLLLARTLQGLVNRKQVRMYLISSTASDLAVTEQFWLDWYTQHGLITIAGHINLDGALDKFAHEASGFLVASYDKPWSINAAVSIGATEGALVATSDLATELTSRGLTQLDDLSNRWADGATAYEDVYASYHAKFAYQGVAVLDPSGDRTYDFAYQQGMDVIYFRPDQADWPRMRALVAKFPAGHPVYGYVASTGDEEATAIAALSQMGKVLVASDKTSNLSFQLAVSAGSARAQAASTTTSPVAPCKASDLNVVVAISDGDNLTLPTRRYVSDGYWQSPNRGTLPLGWSLPPGLAVLAPAMWDYYATTAGPNDELVEMIGYGYASAVAMPDPQAFYARSFGVMRELGMTTFWSFAAFLDKLPGLQKQLDTAAGNGIPNSILEGYGDSGPGVIFHTPAGRPGITSPTSYATDPAGMAQIVTQLLATPPAQRPLVTFLSASVWNNSADGLNQALTPLAQQGVRFLTPSQAAACMPKVTPPPPPSTTTTTTTTTAPPATISTSVAIGGTRSPVATPISATPTFAG